ncbi:MAG: dodecin domain-containing protein [Actinobacteria bacterium]|nr:dodecin domain-containing protein [Actinomycetota bacterium]
MKLRTRCTLPPPPRGGTVPSLTGHPPVPRACQTLDQVKGAWISEQQVVVEDGAIVEYRVNMRVTFVLK